MNQNLAQMRQDVWAFGSYAPAFWYLTADVEDALGEELATVATRTLNSEEQLLMAILERAWIDATGTKFTKHRGRARRVVTKQALAVRQIREQEAEMDTRDALRWFADESSVTEFTFVGLCHVLSLSPTAVRSKLALKLDELNHGRAA